MEPLPHQQAYNFLPHPGPHAIGILDNTPIGHGPEEDLETGPLPQSSLSPEASSGDKKDGQVTTMGMFQCSFCKKCYNRADHLQRHVRSHSGEKPYPCKICNKSFGRPDLLKRHAEAHVLDREDGSKRRRLNPQAASSSRVTQACKSCSASKLKCEESKPCGRCRAKGLVCEPVHVSLGGLENPSEERAMGLIEPFPSSAGPSTGNAFRLEESLPTPSGSDQSSVIHGWNDNVVETDQGFFPDIVGIKWSLARSLRVAADYVDQGIATPTLVATTSMTQEPYDWTSAHFNEDNFRSSLRQATDPPINPSTGLGGEAGKSTSEWQPRPEETDYREHPQLALPKSLPIKARRKPQTQLLREHLDYTARDRLLNVVIRNVQPENIEKIIRSFPATELYDDFMQHFFNIFTDRIDNWIHAWTFKPNDAAAELLLSVIATGAVYQEQHVLRTIGYAMLEQARAQIPKTIEMHNTFVREHEIQQAYLLQIETRLFCCNKRKMEIAEAMFQPGVTMLRRSRQFRRKEYETVLPEPLESSESLQDRWRKWAKQEERKRTVFHTFIHDAQAAVLFNTTPLIVFSELSLPLPESETLWRARSAQEWQSIYQQRGLSTPPRLPSLIDALQDLSCLTTHAEFLDINFALLVTIYALWSLVCQHREMKNYQNHVDWQNPGADSTAYSKCFNRLETINSMFEQLEPLRPEVMLMHAFVSMHLHISFSELHLFAGKADREDAHRSYSSARQWIESPSSRQAAYHAGQVLRWARAMPRYTIRDFYISTLYYTGLVLWSYGVLSRARRFGLGQPPPPPPSPVAGDPIVMLDNRVSPNLLHSFITTNVKFESSSRRATLPTLTPVVSHYRTLLAALEDPSLVMDELQHTLQSNWDQGPPELLRGIRKLLTDLGSTTKLG